MSQGQRMPGPGGGCHSTCHSTSGAGLPPQPAHSSGGPWHVGVQDEVNPVHLLSVGKSPGEGMALGSALGSSSPVGLGLAEEGSPAAPWTRRPRHSFAGVSSATDGA